MIAEWENGVTERAMECWKREMQKEKVNRDRESEGYGLREFLGGMRCSDTMARIHQGDHNFWHDYCPIRDVLHLVPPAVMLCAGLENIRWI